LYKSENQRLHWL